MAHQGILWIHLISLFLFLLIYLIPQNHENKNTVKNFFNIALIGVILKIVNFEVSMKYQKWEREKMLKLMSLKINVFRIHVTPPKYKVTLHFNNATGLAWPFKGFICTETTPCRKCKTSVTWSLKTWDKAMATHPAQYSHVNGSLTGKTRNVTVCFCPVIST